MNLTYWRIIPLLVFMLIAAFLWKGLSLKPRELPSTQIGKQIPAFQLQALGLDKKQKIFSSKILKGRPLLLNIWSSWCEACTTEQAFLLKLAEKGVVIYGLNYKDERESALNWLQTWGDPYVLSGLDNEGRVGFDLGVYGSPETFLIDKNGIIRYRYPGILNESVWRENFLPLINQLEKVS